MEIIVSKRSGNVLVYIAVKVDDEKFNKVETIILPNQ